MRLLWPMRNDRKSCASFIFFLSHRFLLKTRQKKMGKSNESVIIIDIKYTQLGFVLRQTKFACFQHIHSQKDGRKLCDALAHILCAQILIFADLLLDKAVAHLLHRNLVSNGGWRTNESIRSMEEGSYNFSVEFSHCTKANSFPVDIKTLTCTRVCPMEKRANILRAIFLMLGA